MKTDNLNSKTNKTNISLCDKSFTLRDDDTFNGIIPIINKISDREIDGVIKRWRKLEPTDKRTDEELRPYVVNTILASRKK
jgi:hypothetical protein